jgi:two-component system phosphate regulon response regulator PhoB
MARDRILLVDDEEAILELLSYNLTKEGYSVTCAASGEDALKEARAQLPDLIVLDLLLPGVDGLEVCRRLKADAATSGIPVLMLTAKGEETDIVAGLELGADDYVTKPFSPRVLIARIRAVLRRKAQPPRGEADAVKVHDLMIHPGRHEVLVKDRPVELTHTEFRILHLLARRPGWVYTRAKVIDALRGAGYPVTDRSVDVHVVALRKKLGAGGKFIETVRGVGYRFKE